MNIYEVIVKTENAEKTWSLSEIKKSTITKFYEFYTKQRKEIPCKFFRALTI